MAAGKPTTRRGGQLPDAAAGVTGERSVALVPGRIGWVPGTRVAPRSATPADIGMAPDHRPRCHPIPAHAGRRAWPDQGTGAGVAPGRLPKSPSASAASHANTAHAAAFCASACGSILSKVSSAVWCRWK